MDAIELKSYIFTNNHVETILESIGCHHISSSQKEWRCGLPEHHNKTSVSIKKSETLKGKIYHSEDAIVSGDIITIVMDIRAVSFPDALKYIHGVLGIEYKKVAKKVEKATQSPLDIFKKVKRRGKKIDISDIPTFQDSVLDEYVPHLTLDWIREGIISSVAREFRIGFDYKSRRIVVPHRSFQTGEIIGIMGRTIIENFELFDIAKYLPLKAHLKSLNLYGLYENYKCIQEAGCMVMGESEKHVLKRNSRLDRTSVAVCCHDPSPEQIKIAIGLDVEVVICMDKGVSEQHIWKICNEFYGIRPISYMFDYYDVLDSKESFSDKPDKIYKWAFKHRVKFDESKRKEYLEWVNGKINEKCK